jgi:hypothetical protein
MIDFLLSILDYLGHVAQKVAIGVGAIQLIGLFVLLSRRKRT